jgi:hypothetical protein
MPLTGTEGYRRCPAPVLPQLECPTSTGVFLGDSLGECIVCCTRKRKLFRATEFRALDVSHDYIGTG